MMTSKQCVDGGGGGGDHLPKFILYLQKLKLGVRGIFIHTNSSLQRASTTMGLNSLDSFFNKLVVRAFIVLCSTVKFARSQEIRICPLKIPAFTIEPVCVCVCVCVRAWGFRHAHTFLHGTGVVERDVLAWCTELRMVGLQAMSRHLRCDVPF